MPERTAEISSKQNPLIRRVKRLEAQTRARKKQHAFVVEGAVFLSLAIRNDRGVEALLYCEALLDEAAGRPMVRQLQADNVQCVSVTRQVFEHVSQRNNPDGLAAIVAGGWVDVADLAAGKTDVFVCLNDIADPGNLGTILRTIDSAGASGCILVGDSTDPYHPRTVRASRGPLFSVRVAHAADMDAVWAWARRRKVHTAATSARGGESYWHVAYGLKRDAVGVEAEAVIGDRLAADGLEDAPQVLLRVGRPCEQVDI